MLATDYDGTIATEGKVTQEVEKALLQAKQAGYLISLVTGRGFENLLYIFPQVKKFDLAVVENGSILYFPSQEKIEYLGRKPPIEFLAQLMEHRIPFHQNAIMATVHCRFVEKVKALIDEFKFPLYIMLHKEYGLILPKGINKAKGLEKALLHFHITSNQVIAMGDASNDLDFLDFCGFKVAVGNAEDDIKAKADWIATKEEGLGVVEFIQEYLFVS